MKIALSDPDQAYGIMEKSKLCLVPGSVDISSRFILPLVYQNLMGYSSRIEPSTLDYFRKLYLRTHADNTKRILMLETLAKAFQKAGLQLTLLKGSAMLLLYYRKAGLRPMSDCDIYIPFDKIDVAVDLLNSLGWKAKSIANRPPIESYYKWVHGYEFYNAEGQWIDLHWHILHECCYAEADNDFFQGAMEFDHNGVRYFALNPGDQLLHAFVQGARCEGVVYLRWVADAARVIQQAGAGIDWQRFICLARKYRLILQVRNALAYMKERIGIPVPEKVLEELCNLPVSKTERFEYHYKRQRIDNRLFSYWPVLWFDYSRQMHNKRFILKIAGFPGFLRDYWGIKNTSVFFTLFKTMINKMLTGLSYR